MTMLVCLFHRVVCGDFICIVPRRLSLDENVRAKEGGKETMAVPFAWSLAVHH